MKKNRSGNRSGSEDTEKKLNTRKFAVSMGNGGGAPSSLSEDTRSVGVVIASETDSVLTYDYDLGRAIPEILIMSGFVPPDAGQAPLLDSHGRYTVDDVLGSIRDFEVKDDQLHGRAFYSATKRASDAFEKTKEGHLTDYSVGWRATKPGLKLGEDQMTEIDGKTYTGPAVLITEWSLKEVSTCPIGADPNAKARGDVFINKSPEFTGQKRKGDIVDPKLRAFLERSGLSVDATEKEAYAFLERMEVKKEGPERAGGEKTPELVVVDSPEKIRADELLRIRSIEGLCNAHDCAAISKDLIDGGKSLEDARAEVLVHIEARIEKDKTEKPGFRAEIGVESRDKFRAAAEDSLIVRAGMTKESYADGYGDLRGYTMTELSRLCLKARGQDSRGDAMDVVGRALTSSDLPIILGSTANQALAEGWETAEETWQEFCAEGSVSDFKQQTIARASETDDLDEIGEDGEYKYGSMEESKEAYQIATYGKMCQISRQALVNDDLSVLSEIPRKHGEAAARKVGDMVFAGLTANSAMGDGIALFHLSHGNLGSGSVIGVNAMAAALKAMGMQKDLRGIRRLNIRPQFFIAPFSIEAAAETFFMSEKFDSTNKAATTTNIYAGTKYKRIYESRLDDDSETAYYLLGAKGRTMKIFFLNGNKAPFMESRQGFTRDGIEFKVRIDAAAKALDWKTMYKNPGA